MKTINALIASSVLLMASSVMADQVAIPAGQQGGDNQSVPKPRTGMSMDQVSSQYGSPNQQVSAVGEPPISRWIYNAYTVYFENSHVIHSVTHPNN